MSQSSYKNYRNSYTTATPPTLEKKPSLYLLFESSLRSEEGRGAQQISPELQNKAFSKTILV